MSISAETGGGLERENSKIYNVDFLDMLCLFGLFKETGAGRGKP